MATLNRNRSIALVTAAIVASINASLHSWLSTTRPGAPGPVTAFQTRAKNRSIPAIVLVVEVAAGLPRAGEEERATQNV